MGINIEGPPAEKFSAEHAVSLWWKDCTRRPNQAPRKEYKKKDTDDNPEESEPEELFITLDAWDDWM